MISFSVIGIITYMARSIMFLLSSLSLATLESELGNLMKCNN